MYLFIFCYFLGGSSRFFDNNDILEYDPETDKWTQIGTIREPRRVLGVSVVNYRDYADWCEI